MLRATLRRDDVSRETKRWVRERDALGRAVQSARADLRAVKIDRALDRWLDRINARVDRTAQDNDDT